MCMPATNLKVHVFRDILIGPVSVEELEPKVVVRRWTFRLLYLINYNIYALIIFINCYAWTPISLLYAS